MPIRVVTFDMDGVMFNTESVYSHVGAELLRRRGYEFTPELKDAMMGLPPQPSFEAMIRCHNLTDKWEDLAAESNEVFLGLLRRHLDVMPGLFELLEALERANIPKAIATSSCWELTEACLRPFDLFRRFQFVLTAEDIVRGKPDPDVYFKTAERFGVLPCEMLVLEDSQAGCRAAVAAGAFTVAVPGEHSRGHDFTGAAMVIDTLADPRLYEVLGLPERA